MLIELESLYQLMLRIEGRGRLHTHPGSVSTFISDMAKNVILQWQPSSQSDS